MKTAELTGALLDYWVARAEGDDTAAQMADGYRFQPSTSWAQGGPIIDRERITVMPEPQSGGEWGAAYVVWLPSVDYWTPGATALQAAMRAYVASKFGLEVPDDVAEGGA